MWSLPRSFKVTYLASGKVFDHKRTNGVSKPLFCYMIVRNKNRYRRFHWILDLETISNWQDFILSEFFFLKICSIFAFVSGTGKQSWSICCQDIMISVQSDVTYWLDYQTVASEQPPEGEWESVRVVSSHSTHWGLGKMACILQTMF